MEYRIEHDSMGEVKVPADRYWGAQTQRSIQNFPIGVGLETMPREIIHAFGYLKKAAALANHALRPEKMTDEKCSALCAACDEVISGTLSGHFPLVVWQTGSGTQSNMNANEVIANRGNAIAGKKLLHPNDDVNMSQSSNDTFPTAMHIAAVFALEDRVIPAAELLIAAFRHLQQENKGIAKSGRTHLQDATPITFSQEISGWRSSLERSRELILAAIPPLKELALGGTAVGTGLNAPAGFDTAVAAAVSYTAAKNGLQAALMAPTEILAEQHFNSFIKMMSGTGLEVALLTGSTTAKKRAEILSRLKYGDINLIIGTHAIIQDDVEFNKLGLVITDEQHRFGVNQRALLSAKGNNPHVLVMSATPIPRTLALMIYGDLDISVLDELPPGRQEIETFVIGGKLHERAYGYIRKHLDDGLQGYIVCPLVADDEENENSSKIAAENYAKKLKNGAFKGYSVGLLHGKMKSAEKEAVMHKFASGQIQLLISTTVIEVGVDVPNAVIMMIENADMFGLSQLHQLRGRVGRGKHKSTCILVSDAEGDEAKARLGIIKSTTDGFKISEEDLKLRGPGDFFGNRQNGLPAFKIANIFADIDIVRETKNCVTEILENDPTLSLPKNEPIKKEAGRIIEKMGKIEMN